MHRKISVRNQLTHLRNAIIFIALAFAVIFGGASLVKFILGGGVLAEDSSGLVPGTGGQTLYAYVKPGEIVEATLTAIAGGAGSEGGPLVPSPGDSGPNYCTSLGQAPLSIYCNPGYPDNSNNPESAKVTIYGPNDAIYSDGFTDEFNSMDPATRTVHVESLPADSAGGAAVWKIQIDQDIDLFMRFRWEVNVLDGTTPKPGRIWANEIRISQINSKEGPIRDGVPIDLVYWAQRSDGYRYKITQKGYNGFGSVLQIGAFGVGNTTETKCVSAYRSAEIPRDMTTPNQNNWPDFPTYTTYIPDPAGETGKNLDNPLNNNGKCSSIANYRIFFDEPDPDIPSTPVPDFAGRPVQDIYREDPLVPSIRAEFISTNNYVGKVRVYNWDTDESEDGEGTFFGNAVLELDTNGGSTANYDLKIPFGIYANIVDIDMDGTKSNNGGALIPLGTLVRGRIVLTYLGEIHIVSVDIEMRSGGIEVERLNGSTSDEAKTYALFWNDDAPWLSPSRATTTPQKKSGPPSSTNNGTNSKGGVHGWTMPDTYASCTFTYTEPIWDVLTPTMKDKLLNPPSPPADPDGVIVCPFEVIGHFNERQLQPWGDNRAIEDWTFDIDRTALLQQIIRDESYFDYIFRDTTPPDICAMSDADFLLYVNSLTSESAKLAAMAERAACPTEPGKQPTCKMTLAEIAGILGSMEAAEAFWVKYCDEPYKPPVTGGRRTYFY